MVGLPTIGVRVACGNVNFEDEAMLQIVVDYVDTTAAQTRRIVEMTIREKTANERVAAGGRLM